MICTIHVPLVPQVLVEQLLSPGLDHLTALVLHLHHLGSPAVPRPTPALDAELLLPRLEFVSWLQLFFI